MRRKALKVAFPHTLPILTGFAFLGLAYGIYMNTSGFPFYYPMLMSMLIFGGSLEFVAVEMLLSPFAPLQVFIMALLIQARHLFYGLSMLEKYKGMGWKSFFSSSACVMRHFRSIIPQKRRKVSIRAGSFSSSHYWTISTGPSAPRPAD